MRPNLCRTNAETIRPNDFQMPIPRGLRPDGQMGIWPMWPLSGAGGMPNPSPLKNYLSPKRLAFFIRTSCLCLKMARGSFDRLKLGAEAIVLKSCQARQVLAANLQETSVRMCSWRVWPFPRETQAQCGHQFENFNACHFYQKQ